MTTCLELSTAATPETVAHVRGRVAEAAARVGATEEVVDDVRLCVGEAVANAALHAYGPEPGPVDVSVEVGHGELTVVVRDEGRGLGRARPGSGPGYGLRIIEHVPRRFLISSAPNLGTEVRMVFGLRGPPAPAFGPMPAGR